MVPGRNIDAAYVLQLAWDRKWTLLVSAAIFGTLAALAATQLPDRYRAEALIQAIPQQILPEYAATAVPAGDEAQRRLQAVTDIITARPHLERIARDLGLYTGSDAVELDAKVEELRRHTVVEVTQRTGSFRVAFDAREPDLAVKVAERLADLVLRENVRDRQALAAGTSAFLESQLEDARRRLVEQEKQLEAFRLRYSGQLPSQLESNLQALQSLQMQVQSLVESLNLDKVRLLTVERMIADLSVAPAPSTVTAPAAGTPPGAAPLASLPADAPASVRLAAARDALSAAEGRLTSEHPDVAALKRMIAKLEVDAAEEARRPRPAAPTAAASPAELQRQNRLIDLRAERVNLEKQIAFKQEEERNLRAEIAGYRSRVDATPRRESGLAELTRDYDTLQTAYKTLLARREEAKITENLEQRQGGEQYKILEPPERPSRPAGPNRALIDLGGALFGLLVGIGLIALGEFRDQTIRTERELALVGAGPVLVSIPDLPTPRETRRASARRVVKAIGGLATVGLWLFSVARSLT